VVLPPSLLLRARSLLLSARADTCPLTSVALPLAPPRQLVRTAPLSVPTVSSAQSVLSASNAPSVLSVQTDLSVPSVLSASNAPSVLSVLTVSFPATCAIQPLPPPRLPQLISPRSPSPALAASGCPAGSSSSLKLMHGWISMFSSFHLHL
jgi:hypothetical protein